MREMTSADSTKRGLPRPLREESCSSRVSVSMIDIGDVAVSMSSSTIHCSIFETAAVLTGNPTGNSSFPSTSDHKTN